MAGEEAPKYRQIADDLRARIESGEYAPGSRLPSKADLMSRYGVALGTVDRAINYLRGLGVVETVQGTGMFVREPQTEPSSEYEAVMTRVEEISEEVRQLRERMSAVEKAKGVASQ